MRLFFIVILIFISSCKSLPQKVRSDDGVEIFIHVEKDTLFFRGEITPETNLEIFEVYNESKEKPTLFSIHSPGGEIGAGIELAEWIYDNNMDVKVDRLCASSCANYVFPAGKNKFLKNNSIVVWHGGAHQPSFDKYLNEHEKYFTQLRQKERSFYNKINVNCTLPTYGIKYVKPYHLWFASFFDKIMLGFDYSLNDLAKFGVKNIFLQDVNWDWRKHTGSNVYAVRVVVNELANSQCTGNS